MELKSFFFLFCSVLNDGNVQLKQHWWLEESKNISAAIKHRSFYAGASRCLTDVWHCSGASPGGDLSLGTLRWANVMPAFPFIFFFPSFLPLLHPVGLKSSVIGGCLWSHDCSSPRHNSKALTVWQAGVNQWVSFQGELNKLIKWSLSIHAHIEGACFYKGIWLIYVIICCWQRAQVLSPSGLQQKDIVLV